MKQTLENIPMQMEDTTEKWINDIICEPDREEVRAFFNDFRRKKFLKNRFQPSADTVASPTP